MNELYATVRDLTNATVNPVYQPGRAGDVRDSQADISKAKRLLGYEPTVSFEEGLARTVAWFTASSPTVA